MYYSKKIEKLYRVSLMALAIGLSSAIFSSAQALLPPGSNAPSNSPAFPNTENGVPVGMPMFKDGVAIPTPSGGMITPSDGPSASTTKGTAPIDNNKAPTGPKTSDPLAPVAGINASGGGLPSINQDNPLFVKPQVTAEKPSAPQKEEDILSAVDNELFNQMSDIEKQTALLTLELRREKIQAEIDAMKAQRQKALEAEKDLDAERENKRLAMEKELEQKIVQEQIKLRKVELAYEKLRQERLLNSYKEHMLLENQKWIKANQEIYNEIAEQKKEQNLWAQKYKEKLQNALQQSQNLLNDAQNKMNSYKKEVNDLQAQISILKARLETQQRPNPFSGGAESSNVNGEGGKSSSVLNLGDLYVIMEITGQGDNISAKLLNRDGQTFLVKKGTQLKSGDIVEEIAPTYLKADRNGEKSYLYFAAGGILETEPDFGGVAQMVQDEANKNKSQKPETNPRGLVSSRGVPGITRDMMLR